MSFVCRLRLKEDDDDASVRAEEVPFDILLGETLTSVRYYPEHLFAEFVAQSGRRYFLLHQQDCCESVYLQDIIGDLADLINDPLLEAEEVSNPPDPPGHDSKLPCESHTWTFYKLATRRGAVTLRWLGESNGYYSEQVKFFREVI